jgi:hypothetical protein
LKEAAKEALEAVRSIMTQGGNRWASARNWKRAAVASFSAMGVKSLPMRQPGSIAYFARKFKGI